ncbi:uncharacterized protein LOC121600502 [Anopheles merus]|nr:uncharacterized protein LOC121600502 [Anopheles merus]XP_041785089.1 uncharacterized protein LOC121600502 [Anopheles merus]XP_041785090.1 uncharacterized protein LOC121600502 [Anopheles merus]XP_041785091.1 uncharacterized protein LOC121600502 [Anopheles merus]XP_041785092.1 uncharacterized protein LOC121600502 [Anopheles merus]XP_041785093.1 uncharacterized protein LOC121600502 [Anopheles merus]
MNATEMEEESVPEQQLPAEVKDEFGRKRIFGQQGTLRLIECVHQRPKLWHRQYLRSRASGIEDWEEIQRTEFSTISVNQLRVRWKTLRDCFRREAKRMEDGRIPAIRWPLYDHMQFLHGHFRLKKSKARKNGGKTVCRHERVSSPLQNDPDDAEVKQSIKFVPIEENIKHDTGPSERSSNEQDVKEEDDASIDDSEVTYKNKFRPRSSKSASSTSTGGGWMKPDAENPDCRFLMSLTPFLNDLPAEENLKIRIKMLQLVAAANRSSGSGSFVRKERS